MICELCNEVWGCKNQALAKDTELSNAKLHKSSHNAPQPNLWSHNTCHSEINMLKIFIFIHNDLYSKLNCVELGFLSL